MRAYAIADVSDSLGWLDTGRDYANLIVDRDEEDLPNSSVEAYWNGKFLGRNMDNNRIFQFSTLHDIFAANLSLTPRSTAVISNFGTDVFALGRDKLRENEWAVFWYDISESSRLGRFKTEDPQDEVIDDFEKMCKSFPYVEDCPEAIREISTSWFKRPVVKWQRP